ncbi:MAG TPA: AMP-binding protein [Sphingomonadaceae bacterium]|nr:AMP-binding protein [Sphingomonadaceae bacterium]
MRSIDFFDKGVDLTPDRIALIEGDQRMTFLELQRETFRFAAALVRDGAPRQSTVAIYAPNHWTVLVALFGLWRAGCKWVPVNARNAIDANAEYLDYVRCERLFYHSSMAAEAELLRQRVPSLVSLICLDKPNAGDRSLDQFMDGLAPEDYVDEPDCFGNLEEIVGIFATGGTTGASKGVQVTNMGWGTMLATAATAFETNEPDKVCLVVAPLTHAAGPVSTVMLSLGATNIIHPGFDAGNVLTAIEEHKITHMYLPPTALYGVLDHPKLHETDLSSLRRFLVVGSPVAPDKLRQAAEIFGDCMCQCYGQVESPMILTWLPPQDVSAAAKGDRPQRLASCGKATTHVRLGIMDDDGKLLDVGERGEIVARGPLVSLEYFELPEATAEAHRNGWHHTGDVGYRDAEGYFYIVDRKKDMIVTGGFNVFSAEVEAAIMEMPEIMEAAVIGVPDPKWGEAIKALVVVAQGQTIDPQAIIAYCKQRLGGVKAPKSVELVDSLPKTAAAKMDKKALRARYWRNEERLVH